MNKRPEFKRLKKKHERARYCIANSRGDLPTVALSSTSEALAVPDFPKPPFNTLTSWNSTGK